MDYKFDEFYESLDKNVLSQLQIQSKAANNIKIIRYILIGLCLMLYFGSRISGSGSALFFLLFIVSLIALVIFYATSQQKVKAFRSNYKKQIISKIITMIDPMLSYEFEQGFPKDVYNNSGISENYTNYFSDDLIIGILSGVPIQAAEIFTEKVVSNGKTTHKYTMFKGLFMEVRFNKNFSGITKVLPDKENSVGNFFEKAGQKLFGDTNEAITLESNEFNEAFNVYSTDQVEARYILSTSFMEKLLLFKQQVGCKVYFSFKNSNMYIKVNFNRELFEPNTSGNCVSKEEIYPFYSFMKFIEAIIIEFKLNQNLWKVEN